MTRVDIPTLECDRCGNTTQDIKTMAGYMTLTHYHVSGSTNWDLCIECGAAFQLFITEQI